MKKIMFLILIFQMVFGFSLFKNDKNQKNLSLDNFILITKCSQVIKDDLQRKCYLYEVKKPKLNFFKIQYSNINTSISKRLSFKEDKRIPEKYQNKLINYKYSKIDRGHLAADANFDINMTILKTTYLTSNIVPEYPRVNRYIISKIEKRERELVKQTKSDIYVITGANYKSKKFIHNMFVPDYIYIIIYYKIKNNIKNNYNYEAYKVPNNDSKLSTDIIKYKLSIIHYINLLKENNLKIFKGVYNGVHR